MIVCTTLDPDGSVGGGPGRAPLVAVADVAGGQIASWQEVTVGWDRLHDEGSEGAHHARIARFLREQQVEVFVAQHAGAGMQRMLATMGVRAVLGAHGDAREAVVRAAAG
jgi:predicted Fe-Mo cluster-binding NifX family protein